VFLVFNDKLMDGETRYEGSQEHKITTRNLMEKMDDVSKI